MARRQTVSTCFLGILNPKHMEEDLSDSQEDHSVADLFRSEEYVEQHVQFGQQTIRLLASPSACSELANSPWPPAARFCEFYITLVIPCAADHDLTGQILWPAAALLAEYLEAHAQQWLTGCPCAVELGSGLGMAGLLASKFCNVILTDHNEVRLTQQTASSASSDVFLACRWC